MPEPELFLIFVRRLNSAGIRYMISGSVAGIFYGDPRLTNDVDLICHLRHPDVDRFLANFPETEFYVPPLEAITLEMAREQRGHFNLIHLQTGFKADVYLAGRDELHAFAFRHARTIEYQGENITLAPPEYVIVRKLEYFREGGSEKHLRDIRSIMAVSGDYLEKPALENWIDRRGLAVEWQRATTTN